jgi:hypothetical protein
MKCRMNSGSPARISAYKFPLVSSSAVILTTGFLNATKM